MKIEFKDIPGYENLYQINNNGEIFSIRKNKTMKPHLDKDGYVRIYLNLQGKVYAKRVHRLVMLAFVGPSDLTVNHKDGDKTNNNLDNLEYISQKENMRHAFKNKLRINQFGEKANYVKLTEKEVLEIRELRKNGTYLKDLAKKYSVSVSTITSLVSRRSWSHI